MSVTMDQNQYEAVGSLIEETITRLKKNMELMPPSLRLLKDSIEKLKGSLSVLGEVSDWEPIGRYTLREDRAAYFKFIIDGLANNGWFVDFDMPLEVISELNLLIKNRAFDKIDELLIEYFERNLTTIKEFLLEQYPDRRKVLEAGFRAHAAKEYELSVLAFLSQVDGMFKEKLSVDFFEKRNKIPARAECYRIYAVDELLQTFLYIFRKEYPIDYSEFKRPKGFTQLNRHMIMHGEAIDYGSRLNSLKALSLVNHIADALMSIDDEVESG